METSEEVESLERMIGQLQGLYNEISQLAKKSPNDGVNAFKLKFVNKVLSAANEILDSGYRPFADFEQFDSDDVPTNSDVTMILSQYMEQAERFRSDNVTLYGGWKYLIKGEASNIEAAPPSRIGKSK
jgi:hypothetical protein